MSSQDSIYISSITLEIQRKCDKVMHHIELRTRTGGIKKVIPGPLSPGEEHKEVFDEPLGLSAQDELSVSMKYQTRLLGIERASRVTMTMKQGEIVKEARGDTHGNQTYMRIYKNIVVTLDISRGPATAGAALVKKRSMLTIKYDDTLSPTTSEILRVCPRFRLLIIGNSGVGKTSLIRNVFGVRDVLASEASRGQADIDKEFVAAGNGLFVLHDSLGLEAAEGNNLRKVKDFVRARREKEDLKEKLHAVWVCLQVPYAKGRLLEAGMEEFLRDRKQILGDIPIVVVLTKLDLLDNQLMLKMRTEGVVFRSIDEAKPRLEPRRAMYLEEHCARLLVRATGGDVPHVAVSTKSGYGLEPTISELVKTTTSEIERYIRADPSYERNAQLYVAGMAQRVSIEEKVDLTIEIGKKRYWASLGVGLTSSLERMEKQLAAIHRDIIQVWNFNDPENALQDDKFKGALLNPPKLGAGDILSGRDVLEFVPVLGPLISDSVLNVVALPIVGAFASIFHEIYSSPQTAAKRFMAYIADLIYVMKILFILAQHESVTARDVAAALHIYTESTYRTRVHLEVNEFDAGAILPGRNRVLERIEVLIRRYNIADQETSRLRSQ